MELLLREDELDEISRRAQKKQATLAPRGPRLLGLGEAFGLMRNSEQTRAVPGGLTQLLGGTGSGPSRLAATAPADTGAMKAPVAPLVKPESRGSEPKLAMVAQSPVRAVPRVGETSTVGREIAKPTAPTAAPTPTPMNFAELTERRTAFERELERWTQADGELVRAVSVYNQAHRNAGHTPAEATRVKAAGAALQKRLDTHLDAYRRLQDEERLLQGSGRRLQQQAPVGSALFELDDQIRKLSGVGRRTPKQQDTLLELQRGRDYLFGMQRFAQERRLGARAVKVDESGIRFGEPKLQAQFVDWVQRKAREPKEHWAVNLFMKGAGLVGPATTEQVKSWLGGNQQALRQVEKEAGPEPAPPGYWSTERELAGDRGPRRADYEGVARAFGVERPVQRPAAIPRLPPNTTVGHHRRAQIDALNWANQSRFSNNPDVLLRLVKQGDDAKFHGPSKLPAEMARHLRAEEIDYYQRLHARNKYVSGRLRDLGAKELSNPLSLGGALLFDRSLMGVAGRAGKATGGIGLQVLERKAPGLWRELTGQVGAQELRRGALPSLQRFGGRWLIAGSEGAGSLPVLKAGGSTATGKLENIPHDLATGPIEGAGSGVGGAIGRPLTSKLPRALWLWAESRGRGTLGHATGEIASRSLDNGLGLGLTSAAETALRPTLNPEPGERRHLNLDPKQLLTSLRDGGLEGATFGLVGVRRRLRQSLRPTPFKVVTAGRDKLDAAAHEPNRPASQSSFDEITTKQPAQVQPERARVHPEREEPLEPATTGNPPPRPGGTAKAAAPGNQPLQVGDRVEAHRKGGLVTGKVTRVTAAHVEIEPDVRSKGAPGRVRVQIARVRHFAEPDAAGRAATRSAVSTEAVRGTGPPPPASNIVGSSVVVVGTPPADASRPLSLVTQDDAKPQHRSTGPSMVRPEEQLPPSNESPIQSEKAPTDSIRSRNYLFRGDRNYRLGEPIGRPLGPEADSAAIQDIFEHVMKREVGRHGRSSRFLSFTTETATARRFGGRSVTRAQMAKLRLLEAEGVVRMWTPDEAHKEMLRQGRPIEADNLLEAMRKNREIVIEGEIPAGVLSPLQ